MSLGHRHQRGEPGAAIHPRRGGKLTRRTKLKDGTIALDTRYHRDPLGRIDWLTDPVGNKWTYGYDMLSRRKAVHDPDLGNWSYTYYMNSWLKTQTDARAIITALEYNELGQVTQKCVKGGSPAIATEITRNTYDQASAGYFNVGRLTTAWRGLTTANGVCTGTPTAKIERRFDYDAAGRAARQVYVNPTEAATPRQQDARLRILARRLGEAQAAGRCQLDRGL